MKKYYMLGLVVMLSSVIGLCGCNNKADTTNAEVAEEQAQEEPAYPKIVYINNVTYYGTDEICEMVPRKAPDGIIETIIESEIMPDSYNSANFGADQGQIEYMFLDDGKLIVHIGEDWYYFEQPTE